MILAMALVARFTISDAFTFFMECSTATARFSWLRVVLCFVVCFILLSFSKCVDLAVGDIQLLKLYFTRFSSSYGSDSIFEAKVSIAEKAFANGVRVNPTDDAITDECVA